VSVERGYLVLADISGYTGYLAETELDHAHEILAELLGEVVAGLIPPLKLAAIEGDAVFAYGPVDRGETVLEAVETTYVAFLRLRDVMHTRTTCPCNACRQIGSLDLKFLVHHGEYTLQGLTGTPNPIGSDVNLVHRLLKNTVGAETGWAAYVLLTQAALDAVGVPSGAFRAGAESYDHLGEIPTWSYDLAARAQLLQAQQEPDVPIEACDWATEVELPAAPAVVWEWLNDPEKLPLWTGEGNRFEEKERPGGRVPVDGGGTLLRHGFRLFTPVPGRLRRPLCRKVVAADAEANLARLRERLSGSAGAEDLAA
jgi:Protein of unknown function (DUF2652)